MRHHLHVLQLLLICFVSGIVFGQNVYYDYQDGLVVFEIKSSAKSIISNERGVFDVSDVTYLQSLKGIDIVEAKQLHPNIKDEKLVRTYQIELLNPHDVDRTIRILSGVKEIAYAELKELHRTLQVPNDQYYNPSTMWGLFQVQAEGAWAYSTGNSNVVVAVTDNAIHTAHPDLVNKMLPGYNTAENIANPNPCGGNNGFHGTHVSGTVAAETNNGIGVASIGWNVSILPVAIGRCSDGALTGGFDGIIWSADNGADVINMSWGGGGSSQYGQNVCNYAWNQGCILIAAAGNSNSSQQFYPAAYNNVVSVAATNQNDQKASFSQYGTWINISAPGVQIASTDQNNGYQYSQGTSMASPLVAGFMGLMKSFSPNATNTDLINCLYSGADNINAQNPNFIGQLGAGRMNAQQSMACAQQFNVSLDAGISAIAQPQGQICDNTFQPQVQLTNFGANNLTSVTINYNWNGNPNTFSWTGNLSTGQSTIVNLPAQTGINGTYTFTASTSNPNGSSDQNPSNDASSQTFSIDSNGFPITLDLLLDCYADEISWQITDNATGGVVASGGSYTNAAGNQQMIYELCLPAGCYDFTINDTYGDGMYGSQWQNCSVNGNYTITDNDGNVLVQMTAPNGDFGNSATHNFCVNSLAAQNDAGIQNIVSPQGVVCANSIQPQVTLRNYGADPLTSVDINYQTTGGVQVFSWTGNLASGQTVVVTLPAIAVATGSVILDVWTSNPNGLADDNPANDDSDMALTVYTTALPLPYTEDFEGSPFGSGGWTIDNPDNDITWELAAVAGNSPGNTAAKIDFFNYQANSQRDGLISPRISLAGYSSVDMTFEHAYRRYDQTAADSLIIYVSSDCGQTFDRIIGYAENGTGSFATQTTNVNPFTPQTASDWCIDAQIGSACFTVNLNAYVGQDIFVKFESFNAGNVGNNLYIDNINIDGIPSLDPPIPSFSASNNTICEGESVQFTDQSTAQITAWNWTFPGGTPASSTAQNPSVVYSTAGTYNVTLEVTNANGTTTQTFVNEITVNSDPNVNVSVTAMQICSGQSTTMTASGANSYSWDNGLGSGSTKTVSPTTTTTYTVTGSNGASCQAQETITIEVLPAPNVSVVASPSVICQGDQTTITASGADFYTWNNGLSSANEHTVSPNQSAVYTVTGFNSANCSNQASVLVEVQTQPNVQINASATTICEGESTALSASGATAYSWTPTNGIPNPNSSGINVSPSTTTTYTVEGTNNCGTDTESITINVVPLPDAPVIVQNGNDLSVSTNPGETVDWYLDGVYIGSGNTISMQGDGNYEAVVTNENGCEEAANGDYQQTSSLADLSMDSDVILYPNPTNGEFVVRISGLNEDVRVTITDALGRIVRDATIIPAQNESNVNFDLTGVVKGVYMVVFEGASGTFTKKVTIQ
jgi:subtilisin family serine protease